MLALGCDHGGYPLMKEVIKYLEDNKIAFRSEERRVGEEGRSRGAPDH